MTTFKPLYIYLQRPDTGAWITVGRYQATGQHGFFMYAPSYLDARLTLKDRIGSVAIPALGAGLGGLPWEHVRAAIEAEFKDSTIMVEV